MELQKVNKNLFERKGTNMPKIAVLLPCYNESATIAKVVRDFRIALPDSEIYVYDNNSRDGSAELAEGAGAKIRRVGQQGKGHVVRRMFQEIDADCYVMVDSDDTYPADEVQELIEPILKGEADMVIGDRLSSTYLDENKRQFHGFGNKLVRFLISRIFHQKIHDVMTGYRSFNKMFVKSCPVLSNGFEIETEMTLFALDKRFALKEVPITYRDRPAGSVSKLNTFSDGFKVLMTIFNMFRSYKPLTFFSVTAATLLAAAGTAMIPVLSDYFKTGLVPKYPTLIVAGFVALAGLLSFVCGLILDSIKKYNDQAFENMLKGIR